jgi:hypothetical protein
MGEINNTEMFKVIDAEGSQVFCYPYTWRKILLRLGISEKVFSENKKRSWTQIF